MSDLKKKRLLRFWKYMYTNAWTAIFHGLFMKFCYYFLKSMSRCFQKLDLSIMFTFYYHLCGTSPSIKWIYMYIYICNCFLLHNTMTSKCIYHLIDTFATSQNRSTWWQRVKFQHFVAFLTFVLKSGMIIDHKCKYK
jgi:hypothetical protein